MKYSVAAQSVTGRVRKNNEDNFFLDGEILEAVHQDSALFCKEFHDDVPHLIGVFDGMGGYSSGEIASYIAAAITKEYAGSELPRHSGDELLNCLCMEANDAVCIEADGSPMGTTCALLYFHQGMYTVCNVGDSPVFLFQKGILQQISVDHNQRTFYENITGKKAPAGQKFKLTQCIGIPRDELLIEPHIASGQVRGGDFFLICSDGLTDMVTLEDIEAILRRHNDPALATEELTTRAMEAGGRDNITIACAAASNEINGMKSLNSFIKRIFNRK